MAILLELAPVTLPNPDATSILFGNVVSCGPFCDPADPTRKAILVGILTGTDPTPNVQLAAYVSTDDGATWATVLGPTLEYGPFTGEWIPITGYQLGNTVYAPQSVTPGFMGLLGFDLPSFSFSVINAAMLTLGGGVTQVSILGINSDGLGVIVGIFQDVTGMTLANTVLFDTSGTLIDSQVVLDPDGDPPYRYQPDGALTGVRHDTQDIVGSNAQDIDGTPRFRVYTWQRGTVSAIPLFGLLAFTPSQTVDDTLASSLASPAIQTGSIDQIPPAGQQMADLATNKIQFINGGTSPTWAFEPGVVVPGLGVAVGPVSSAGNSNTQSSDKHWWTAAPGFLLFVGAEVLTVLSTGLVAAIVYEAGMGDPIRTGSLKSCRVVADRMEIVTGFGDGGVSGPFAAGGTLYYWRSSLTLVFREGCRYYATS